MKKEIKDFKKDNAGRSMTEMLGVLAIIGVLSLGGIIGYKLAMNRYAANQIAYEINMMKTDAKVKIMQGNDALTLGQPYDGGTIRFGNYGTTFGCSFVQDEDAENIVVEEAETCQVANAYYIELQNIPEGICKPLANLIENMNDLIAFDINPKENGEIGEGGNCEEGENVLNAVFSAEPGDLDVLKCDSEKDCPEDLYCHNHLCVECTDDTHCGRTGHCENNVCEYCESGVWDSATKQCVDCKEPSDCVNNPKGKICENNECVQCLYDTDCPDKENAPHCDSETHTCGNCPIATPYWSDTLSKCVECTSSDFCVNPEPYCNPYTGECTQCTEEAQCDASQNEHCKVKTGECIVCDSTKEVWDEDLKDCRPAKSCDELDCLDDEFCLSTGCSDCAHETTGCIFTCTKLNDYTKENTGDYVMSNRSMNWWSTERFCQAHTMKRMMTIADLDCNNTDNIQYGTNCDWGYCHAKGSALSCQMHGVKNENGIVIDDVSNVIKRLRVAYGDDTNAFWLKDGNDPTHSGSTCDMYHVDIQNGSVHRLDRIVNYALCL